VVRRPNKTGFAKASMPSRMSKSNAYLSKRDRDVGYALQSQVAAPVAFGSTTKVSKAAFGGGRTVIKHSEYVGDIVGSVGFVTQLSMNLNPGIQTSFPWLSQIANAYEKFSVKQIQYRYSSESPSTSTGAVFLSPEYNPQDPPPTSKLETFQNEDTVRTVPWTNVVCKIPTKYLKVYNDYFIRLGAIPNSDLKTYDPIVMYVCTQGQANTALLGEIWVDYQIELINPQGNLNPIGGTAICAPIGATTIFGNINNQPVFTGYLSIRTNTNANNLVLSPCIVGSEYQVTVLLVATSPAAINNAGIAGASTVSVFNGLIFSTTLSVNILTFIATATSVTIGYNSVAASGYASTFVSVLPMPFGVNAF